MSQATAAPMQDNAAEQVEPIKVDLGNFEHGFPEGFGPGRWGLLAYAIGIAFAVFQIAIAAWNILPSQVVRGVHVGFIILMTFGLNLISTWLRERFSEEYA